MRASFRSYIDEIWGPIRGPGGPTCEASHGLRLTQAVAFTPNPEPRRELGVAYEVAKLADALRLPSEGMAGRSSADHAPAGLARSIPMRGSSSTTSRPSRSASRAAGGYLTHGEIVAFRELANEARARLDTDAERCTIGADGDRCGGDQGDGQGLGGGGGGAPGPEHRDCNRATSGHRRQSWDW
jgi:hypothetical protein